MDQVEEELLMNEQRFGPNSGITLGEFVPAVVVWSERGKEHHVLRLLANGADPYQVSRGGMTLLQLAISKRMKTAAQALLEIGVDSNVVGASHTSTPLGIAALNGDEELARILLADSRTDVDATYLPDAKVTPLMSACEYGYLDLAKLLVSHGADVNATSGDGWPPIIRAGMSADPAIARFLLEQGVDAMHRDSVGLNATDWARKRYDGMVAQGFRELGIPDHYVVNAQVAPTMVRYQQYDFFVSYRQLHFCEQADAIRAQMRNLGKSVFVDRHELNLHQHRPMETEDLKAKLQGILAGVSLTVFFEIYWDGTHGEERYDDTRLDWQYFELLNSKQAVMIQWEGKCIRPFLMKPGERLQSGNAVAFSDYESLCNQLVKRLP